MLVILLITGLYMFLYYAPSIHGAYQSVEYMTDKTLVGRYIRSIHRYAADVMMFFVILHLVKSFVSGKYSRHRRLAWVTGVILLAFTLIQGVSGYILPLDTTARFVMEATSEVIASLKFLGDDLSRSFANHKLAGNWIMWIVLNIHFFIPLSFLVLIFLHVKKISRPRLMLPASLLVTIVSILLLFAVFFPVKMATAADASRMPFLEEVDHFYLFLADLMNTGYQAYIWSGFLAVFFLLVGVPWYRKPAEIVPAEVELEKCTGCQVCSQDCPYQAITMIPRTDGRAFKWQPEINTSMCSGCATCVGSCDFGGMGLRGFAVDDYKDSLKASPGTWNLILCKSQLDSMSSFDKNALENSNIKRMIVPCVGMVGPEAIRFLARAKSKGVIVGGCPQGDCDYREGNKWAQHRILSKRKPRFKNIAAEIPFHFLRFSKNQKSLFLNQVNEIIEKDETPDAAQVKLLKPRGIFLSSTMATIIVSVQQPIQKQ